MKKLMTAIALSIVAQSGALADGAHMRSSYVPVTGELCASAMVNDDVTKALNACVKLDIEKSYSNRWHEGTYTFLRPTLSFALPPGTHAASYEPDSGLIKFTAIDFYDAATRKKIATYSGVLTLEKNGHFQLDWWNEHCDNPARALTRNCR